MTHHTNDTRACAHLGDASRTMRTPPADWDRHALEVARGIASIERYSLPGSTTQFTAILQSAIVDAMMMAAEGTLARPAVTIRAGEIQLNAAGLALTDAECETLRAIAERMRRVAEARREQEAAC